MKSVLFITDELRVGGGETYFYKIENLINRKNFNLYTAAENGECYGRIKNKQNFFQLSSNKFKKILQLKKIIKSNNISVVHCNSFNLVIIVIMVKKIFNMTFKILYTKHNATKLDNTEKFKKIINNNVEKLITVCDYDKNTLLGQGILKEKVISIPNGIDIDQFKFKPRYYDENKELNIGILARLSEEKNHKFFLKVIEKLRDSSDIKFKAFIAGDGILKNDIANEIKEKESLTPPTLLDITIEPTHIASSIVIGNTSLLETSILISIFLKKSSGLSTFPTISIGNSFSFISLAISFFKIPSPAMK